MKAASARGHLSDERIDFRARMEAARAPQTWELFGGRIGVVLAGGGGRGAYEAGVLLAFQDAHMPTHMITGSSIGGINAASFAAHSNRHVGNAEPLLRTWMRLTPLAVGIDWTRYVWKVVGLIAASAGAGNFMEAWLANRGVHFAIPHPLSTWAFLAVVGLTLLYFYDSVPYLGYLIGHQFNRATRRRSGFHPAGWKALGSLAANALLCGIAGRIAGVARRDDVSRRFVASRGWPGRSGGSRGVRSRAKVCAATLRIGVAQVFPLALSPWTIHQLRSNPPVASGNLREKISRFAHPCPLHCHRRRRRTTGLLQQCIVG
jgi:hypothetical protein